MDPQPLQPLPVPMAVAHKDLRATGSRSFPRLLCEPRWVELLQVERELRIVDDEPCRRVVEEQVTVDVRHELAQPVDQPTLDESVDSRCQLRPAVLQRPER